MARMFHTIWLLTVTRHNEGRWYNVKEYSLSQVNSVAGVLGYYYSYDHAVHGLRFLTQNKGVKHV